jgi:hypothetical protein
VRSPSMTIRAPKELILPTNSINLGNRYTFLSQKAAGSTGHSSKSHRTPRGSSAPKRVQMAA